jgi:PAS domain S-box-containing protein
MEDAFCVLELLGDGSEEQPIDYRFVEVNAAFARHTGLEGVVGQRARQLFSQIDRAWFETCSKVLHTGATAHFERYEPTLRRWFDGQVIPMGEPDQRRIGVIFREVSSRHEERASRERSEQEARAGEQFALRVIDSLFAFVAILNPAGQLLTVNGPPLALAEVSRDQVQGKPFWDCVWWNHDPQGQERLRQACAAAARGEVVRYDAQARIAGGERLTVDLQIAPLRDETGAITHLIPSGVDITKREEDERALRDSEERFRRLFETNLLGILFFEIEGGIHEANDEFLRIVGYSSADLDAGALDWARMTPPEFKRQDAQAVHELRTERHHRPIEKQYVRKDGGRVWVLVGSAMLEGDRGVAFVLDISKAKATEAALRMSEARAREAAARASHERRLLDAVLDSAAAGIVVADVHGKLVRFNPAHELLWGRPPLTGGVEDVSAWKGWWADGSERHGHQLLPNEWAISRALRGETVRNDIVEIEPFGEPGVRRTTVISGAPVHDTEGRITGAVIAQMDISRLVEAEALLRQSETRFRALADNIAQLAWMTDETGYINWYNRRWYEFTGTTPADMQEWGWQSVQHPEHVQRVLEKFARHLVSGEPWEDTFPMRGRDGQYRWFLSRAFPLRDPSGRIVSWFGTHTDITAQREAEQALRETDRRKDEFIAILAHELRNPLAPVRNAVQLLKRGGRDEARLEHSREVIDRQVTHMARLIDDLLDVSRLARGQLALAKETCDLAAIAAQTAQDYQPSFETKGVRLRVKKPSEPVWVEGDPVRLAQMVGNLLHNAYRFTESGGSVEIGAGVDSRVQVGIVTVADSGMGMEPGLLERLFDPFSQAEQDLARSKGGLGLGLALTKGLAELHGGGVSAESPGPGRGSTFTLRIPLRRAYRQRSSAKNGSPPVGDHLRILVVEDNVDGAETLRELLELDGHEVKVAFDGVTALEAARTSEFDAVVSDLGLPGRLDGYALAKTLRQDPRLDHTVLIALSGYANEDARRRSRAAGFERHLAKPPDLEELQRCLQLRRS